MSKVTEKSLDIDVVRSSLETLARGTINELGNVATVASGENYRAMREAVLQTSDPAPPLYIWNMDETRVAAAVSYSMASYVDGNLFGAIQAVTNSVQHSVENAYRQAVFETGKRDKHVTGYQRVASANACAFCMMVSLNQYTTFPKSGGYHAHCSCVAMPIFRGAATYEPEHYREFEQAYIEGTRTSASGSAKDILAAIRANTGRA